MNAKVLLIVLLVIALVAGVGVAIFLLTRQPDSTSGPAITTPVASPAASPSAAGSAELTIDSASETFVVGETSTLDIYLNTKGESVEGFQFIANVSGSALPAVVDSDTAVTGVQIAPEPIPNMTVATNSVSNEGDRYVVRFAMLLDDAAPEGFTSDTPIKIASLQVTPGSGGSIAVAFSEQNSRVRLKSSGTDSLASVTPTTFSVAAAGGIAQTAAEPTATQSATSLVSQASPTPSSVAPFCLQSCVSDNDCAAGLVCQADRCVNPACATSQTCSCSQTQASATPRATATPVASATPRATATPAATLVAQATVAPTIAPVSEATDSALPTAGAIENTLLIVGAGLLLFGTGVVLASNRATVEGN